MDCEWVLVETDDGYLVYGPPAAKFPTAVEDPSSVDLLVAGNRHAAVAFSRKFRQWRVGATLGVTVGRT